jgi:hypothetical protein
MAGANRITFFIPSQQPISKDNTLPPKLAILGKAHVDHAVGRIYIIAHALDLKKVDFRLFKFYFYFYQLPNFN